MTPQEAIDFIENELQIDVRYCSVEKVDKTKEVFELAKSALEKLMPKKVDVQTEDDREFIDFICPLCKTTLQQKIKPLYSQRYFKNTIYKYRFCLHCGQNLDWSDRNDS